METCYLLLGQFRINLFQKYQAICCITCNSQLQKKIYDSTFFPNLLTMLSAFLVVAIVVIILVYFSTQKYNTSLVKNTSLTNLNPVPLTTASMVLGIGIGGFLDGIVFHQIFQFHAMLSNKISPITLEAKSVNMFWDGIFHFFTLTVVLIGITLLWRLLGKKNLDISGKLLAGGLLFGWGLFNITEGIINHQILELHNVIEFSSDHSAGNFTFIGVSLGMLILGYLIVNKRNRIDNQFTDIKY